MPRGIPNRSISLEQGEQTPGQAEVTQSPRAADTRRERRRRDDGDLDRMGRMALSIPQEVQDRLTREGKTARWVRDNPNRQSAMQANDWDVTPNVEPVAEDREGTGKLVLMEKYRDWWDEDQRKKATVLDERERALERGDKLSPADKRQESTSYVPDGNRFTRQPGA